jgi:elongation factor G
VPEDDAMQDDNRKGAARQGEYAHVSLRVYPSAAGSGYRFEDATIGGSIPKRFMTSIDSGIGESVAKGVLRGYPIVDIRVEVHDGSYHDANSTDAAFQTSAALAVQEAAKKGRASGLGARDAGRCQDG